MSSFSPRMSVRKNSRPLSVPTKGVSAGTPAASRWRGVSVEPLTVIMPTFLPGGRVAWTHGTWIMELVATGTPTCWASSRWNSERKPQLVVIASAPCATSSAAASRKAGSWPAAPFRTTASGVAPLTTL